MSTSDVGAARLAACAPSKVTEADPPRPRTYRSPNGRTRRTVAPPPPPGKCPRPPRDRPRRKSAGQASRSSSSCCPVDPDHQETQGPAPRTRPARRPEAARRSRGEAGLQVVEPGLPVLVGLLDSGKDPGVAASPQSAASNTPPGPPRPTGRRGGKPERAFRRSRNPVRVLASPVTSLDFPDPNRPIPDRYSSSSPEERFTVSRIPLMKE